MSLSVAIVDGARHRARPREHPAHGVADPFREPRWRRCRACRRRGWRLGSVRTSKPPCCGTVDGHRGSRATTTTKSRALKVTKTHRCMYPAAPPRACVSLGRWPFSGAQGGSTFAVLFQGPLWGACDALMAPSKARVLQRGLARLGSKGVSVKASGAPSLVGRSPCPSSWRRHVQGGGSQGGTTSNRPQLGDGGGFDGRQMPLAVDSRGRGGMRWAPRGR